MPAPRLAEATTFLIEDYIKANIASSLALVRADRADAAVTTEPPVNYFIYERALGYKVPAVFIICDNFDFKLSENKANFIDALASVRISVLLEDRNREKLTIKAWRYQSALHSILAEQPISSLDGKVLLTVTVKRNSFSALYSTAKNEESIEAVFRKEVVLECDVYHRENY